MNNTAIVRFSFGLTLLIFLCVVSVVNAQPKPNIVHIMADDLGWQDIASHKIDGKPVYETPNLDRMTEMGRRFTQAYSPAASCAPSRVAFLRGQYPANTGVYHVMGGRIPRTWADQTSHIPPYYPNGLPADSPTIARVLKQAGYTTGHVGKWHIGGKSAGYPFPLDMGFDFGFSEENGGGKYYNDPELWDPSDRPKTTFFGMWARPKPDRLSEFATDSPDDPYHVDEDGRPFDKPTDLAVGFIRQNKNKPFFLNFCTYMVHGPIATRDLTRFEKYLDKMGYAFPADPGVINEGRIGHSEPYYASMVDSFDWMVGQVINYLETTDDPRNPGHKLIDNTYVIISSDNGGWIGSPGRMITDNTPLRGGKQQLYEGGIRIPFIVVGPDVPAGTSADTPINLIDLFPTFMEIAGVESTENLELDGANILPLMTGASENVYLSDDRSRDAIFWFFPVESHMAYAMRQGEWKLVWNVGVYGGGSMPGNAELYRLYNADGTPNDLSEANDLSEQEPERVQAMMSAISQHLAESQVTLPYRNLTYTGSKEEQAASPKVLELGYEDDRVWVMMETGPDKVKIIEATLLYTLNPKPFDSTRGQREEWFAAKATIEGGRVHALIPPGATHASFCMVDANGYLVLSEKLPNWQTTGHRYNDSDMLEHGFKFRPGLFALMELGQEALAVSRRSGLETKQLRQAITEAQKVHDDPDTQDEVFYKVIRELRGVIRNQKGTPQSEHPLINRFPTEPLF